MAVNACVANNVPFARHPNSFLAEGEFIATIYRNIESAKSAAPTATLPQIFILKYCKRTPNVVGVSKVACARSDNIPAVMRITFLNESCDILYKRIAQKSHFFY